MKLYLWARITGTQNTRNRARGAVYRYVCFISWYSGKNLPLWPHHQPDERNEKLNKGVVAVVPFYCITNNRTLVFLVLNWKHFRVKGKAASSNEASLEHLASVWIFTVLKVAQFNVNMSLFICQFNGFVGSSLEFYRCFLSNQSGSLCRINIRVWSSRSICWKTAKYQLAIQHQCLF